MTCPCRSAVAHVPSRLVQRVFRSARLFVLVGTCLLVLLAGQACDRGDQPAAPLTITLTDNAWLDKGSRRRRSEEIRQFTHETGIRVEVITSPGDTAAQLAVRLKLLGAGQEEQMCTLLT
jgi:ABC-type glycerol-3-phosphate transport system substrate-binding protein